MAGGGSSELRQVAVEMAQLAAWLRALQQQQRHLAGRLAKLEGQLDTKKAEAAGEAASEPAASKRRRSARKPRPTDDVTKPRVGDHGTRDN